MAKVIMVQGTMSNAGKSLIVAGLCRIFKQDGYRVAPFKSQNMALNSYITAEGLEMGRAQVMQAEAAGIEPSVYMNPILLKPTSDVGSQVIVNGKVLSNMTARDYFAYKKSLVGDIMTAYNTLAKDNDIIVIEGAGSPAEINLKSDDIVNMGLAKMLKAPVLLAGDIDRGGVFAQLAGTMLLLEDDEKAMVKGLIINKFRGDVTLLDPGIELLKKYTDVPVIGTVPYTQLDIDDEDSLSPRLAMKDSGPVSESEIDIAVIRLPHLSNFTDFNALSRIEGVSLRYIGENALKSGKTPDLILIPGTKNTIGDLRWLKECGLAGDIRRIASEGGLIMGVCGGYQMLGQLIEDPDHVEIEDGEHEEGLGLLPLKTVFAGDKTMTRTQGYLGEFEGDWALLSGAQYDGYEIHMGETYKEDGSKLTDSAFYKGNVLGSYIHGIFDTAYMQRALINVLEKRKYGDAPAQMERSFRDDKEYKEKQYDILADAIRNALDMDAVYRILNEGIE